MRSSSGEKYKTGFDSQLLKDGESKNDEGEFMIEKPSASQHLINEKHWLLIINTGK